jgi:hypothetical protein
MAVLFPTTGIVTGLEFELKTCPARNVPEIEACPAWTVPGVALCKKTLPRIDVITWCEPAPATLPSPTRDRATRMDFLDMQA